MAVSFWSVDIGTMRPVQLLLLLVAEAIAFHPKIERLVSSDAHRKFVVLCGRLTAMPPALKGVALNDDYKWQRSKLRVRPDLFLGK